MERFSQLKETKHAIYHRMHSMKCNRPVHRFKHFPRTHVHRLDAGRFSHESHEVNFSGHSIKQPHERYPCLPGAMSPKDDSAFHAVTPAHDSVAASSSAK